MTANRRTHRTYTCTFCGKDQNVVARLIGGPGGIFICNECIAKIDQNPEASNAIMGAEGSDKVQCSFCGKRLRSVKYIAQGPHGVNICDECIELCLQIIEEEQDVLRRATASDHTGDRQSPQPRMNRRKATDSEQGS